jgi:1-deoxy-D-xylulose 5-phosphate reductoisomerase
VEAFLAGRISFPAISETIEETLQRFPSREPRSVHEVLEIDRQSREAARKVIETRGATEAAVRA